MLKKITLILFCSLILFLVIPVATDARIRQKRHNVNPTLNGNVNIATADNTQASSSFDPIGSILRFMHLRK